MAVTSTVLAPAFVVAEVRGPVFAMGPTGQATLLVPVADALGAFIGLVVTATATAALLGLIIGRTRRAAISTGLAGLGLAIGPGHNIPMLGGTPAVPTELVILVAVGSVASVVLVETERARARRPHPRAETG